MIFALVLLAIVIVLGFGVGIFFVVGAIQHWTILFNPPDAHYIPSFWLGRMLLGGKHEKFLFFGYIISGSAFILIAVFGAIHVIREMITG